MSLPVKRLTKTAVLPTRATDGSAGYDLYADEAVTIPPCHAQCLVSTGIAVAIPAGYCGQIWPRSGMDVNSRITRGAGLIDRDYRGELKVLLINRSATAYEIRQGDRNAGGFGSSGL